MGSGQHQKERDGTETSENWHLIKVSRTHKGGRTDPTEPHDGSANRDRVREGDSGKERSDVS